MTGGETCPARNVCETGCPWCSEGAVTVYHFGEACPRVKAIEYYPNGTIKRVEFNP